MSDELDDIGLDNVNSNQDFGPDLIRMIGGMAARAHVQKRRGCDNGTAEDILRQIICAGFIEIWHKPWFLFIKDVEEAKLFAKKYWPLEGKIEFFSHCQLINICMIQSQLNKVLDTLATADEEELEGAGRPCDSRLATAWEVDKARWIPLEVAVHQVAEATGLPEPAARAVLFGAVNSGHTFARYPLYPDREPSAWFATNGQPRIDDQAPPSTIVDPQSLKAWIAAEFSREAIASDDADPEEQCRAWLAEEMRKSPERSARAKADWYAEGQKLFPGLTWQAFKNRVWPAAIRETGAKWDRPGRKPRR